jgi:hypothetical protein
MTNSIRPSTIPYYHRDYSNDTVRDQQSGISKRVALVALPFLSLYKPLSLPISLAMGSLRVYTCINKLLDSIARESAIEFLNTTISVIALASSIFAHPLGMVITTSQDIFFELAVLSSAIKQKNTEKILVSLTKVTNNLIYLVLLCSGGTQLSIVSLALQAITLIISSREEFKQGNLLEGAANILMALIRTHQGYSQFKILKSEKTYETREVSINPDGNQIKVIYTTVSDGKVHIAADANYIGSVNSYNNFITQFFARLFCYSMRVNFDGKTHSVDKKSYTTLVQTLTSNEKIDKIEKFTIFRSVAQKAILPGCTLRMRDFINYNDSVALYKKLCIAIAENNSQRAMLMIGKGAQLDLDYYDRSTLYPSFTSDTVGLYKNYAYEFTVFKAPPIMQVAKKGNMQRVYDFLKEAGASLNVNGVSYTFNRTITSVEKGLEVVYKPKDVTRHHHFTDTNGVLQTIAVHEKVLVPKLKEVAIVNTQDTRSSCTNYGLDPATSKVVAL